jgi:hypothetical protein
MMKRIPPFLAHKVSKWFYDTFIGTAAEQPAVILYLERAFVSWLLARDEHGEHINLRGSDRWSVTPYVHRRRELYCSSLTLLVCA